MVHHLKRFDYIKMTFPEGGLSYKECDKELGQVDTKACISVPSDRMAKFREASKNPRHYNVIEVIQPLIKNLGAFLRPVD